ncbi:response regulator [Fodinicurvata halophila]|uniref:Response regulator n=1 Tax=Fodinicurvata halophila TaxID=1419723 RepID=A0ABV8UPL3_9PROT
MEQHSQTAAGRTGATILCIEDETYLRQDIVEELSGAGYNAVGASDGLQALTLLETLRPDLILCDISMPNLDGYELLEAVRNRWPALADVPFVFLTALSQREEVINGKRAGADDYLVKPVDYDLMLASIESRLSQVQRMNALASRELDQLREALADSRTGERSGLHRVLDMLSFGVVLIGQDGVVSANRAATAMHQARDGLAIDRELRTDSAALSRELRTLLAESCALARESQEHIASLSIPRPSGRRDLLLISCALPGATEGAADEPLVVVFLSDPERRTEVPSSVLAELFDLTPTESEVARALAQGRRTEQIAEDLGVSQTTVAFHLRNLFDKTGTNRQADLVALVLTGLASIAPL